MDIMGWLFGKNRKAFKLDDMSMEEVRADQIRLERREQKLEKEHAECQQEIEEITQEAVASGRKAAARTATRKIMLHKERSKELERSMAIVSRELMALGRLRRLLEARERVEHSVVFSTLTDLEPGELEKLLTGEMAREEAREKGLMDIVEILDGPLTAQDDIEESPEAKEIMEAIIAAQEANDPTLAERVIRHSDDQVSVRDRDEYGL